MIDQAEVERLIRYVQIGEKYDPYEGPRWKRIAECLEELLALRAQGGDSRLRTGQSRSQMGYAENSQEGTVEG